MSYFLVAVSNRENLDLCLRYGLAGFTSSASGLWTYLDIREGDFVSFLYGARVFNLYEVVTKTCYLNAQDLPPWPSVTFEPSGRTYYFPFRAQLRPIRTFDERLVRMEFAYVGENLLLRGGYRKTHFQADQTTLQAVSEMGTLAEQECESLDLGGAATFTPLLTSEKSQAKEPEVYLFKELFLQAIVRSYVSRGKNLSTLLVGTGLADHKVDDLEVLSEKAFPEGHVDLLVKEATPKGVSKKVVIEVKRRAARKADVDQLTSYRTTLGSECAGTVLLASVASPKVRQYADGAGVLVRDFTLSFPERPAAFEDLLMQFGIS